jgi:Chloramphenicol 3-O-phosphotransferase
MDKGSIIFLNGVLSAGKTTLTRALQKKLPEYYFWLANDTFCDMNPDKLWEADPLEAEYQALSMLNHTIKLFSDRGKNVIVDHVLASVQKNSPLKECVGLLHDYPVLFVHVTCPPDELRRREKERGDRRPGQAESQLPLIIPQDTYDITVDTYYNTPEECADMIIKKLETHEGVPAFEILYQLL